MSDDQTPRVAAARAALLNEATPAYRALFDQIDKVRIDMPNDADDLVDAIMAYVLEQMDFAAASAAQAQEVARLREELGSLTKLIAESFGYQSLWRDIRPNAPAGWILERPSPTITCHTEVMLLGAILSQSTALRQQLAEAGQHAIAMAEQMTLMVSHADHLAALAEAREATLVEVRAALGFAEGAGLFTPELIAEYVEEAKRLAEEGVQSQAIAAVRSVGMDPKSNGYTIQRCASALRALGGPRG